MPNLAQSQAEWTALFKEWGSYFGPKKDLRELERKFDLKRNRIQVRDNQNCFGTAFGITTEWKLSGVKIGVNTDDDGILYVRIDDETPGAGQARVKVYKATGGGAGDLVAQGDGANGATVTLAAQNSSGLTGTVKIGTVTASESDDKHRLRVTLDWSLRANHLFDGSKSQHGDMLRAYNAACVVAQQAVRAAILAFDSAESQFLLGRMADFQKSGQESPIEHEVASDEGLVSVTYKGVLEDVRRNMIDELTAGPQTVLKNSLSAAPGVFQDSANDGRGAMSAPSVEEWALPGEVTFTCIDETVGSEQFEAVQKVDVTGEVRRAEQPLQIKRTFADPVIGIRGALLTRTLELEAGVANDFATAADFNITGEKPGNTESGKLHLKIVKGTIDTSKWKIQFYRSSSYTTQDLMGESNEAAAGATGVGINQKNTSGLGGTCKIGAAPTENNTGRLDLQCFRKQNSVAGRADVFRVTISQTARGEFQDRIGETHRYGVNSAASNPTIKDAYVAAGTFPPYEVRDA